MKLFNMQLPIRGVNVTALKKKRVTQEKHYTRNFLNISHQMNLFQSLTGDGC